jgi:3-hydroxypropanoate dehydrogenase
MNITTEQIFDTARTANLYLDKPVDDALLHQLYDMMKFGPTSANCSPARIQFVKSAQGKARLVPCMIASNVEKTQSAPVTAIIGMDMQFYDKLPQLFPHTDARAWFTGNQALIDATAFRNSALQGGYLIIAARALGLDCGPMSGFDNAQLDAEFWGGTQVKTNFVCTLGYADTSKTFARNMRLPFAQACQIV